MPSQTRKTDTVARPSPKDRAVGLRLAAERRSAVAPAVPMTVPPAACPSPALIRLIREHNEVLAAGNSGQHSDAVANTLINRSFELFDEACAIPAANPADLIAKFGMIEHELRDAAESLGSRATGALDTLASDLRRVLHTESLKAAPEAKASDDARLSGLTLPQLRTLFETVRALWLHAGAELQAPWCWDEHRRNYNAAGKALDGECDRLAGLQEAIVTEAERRPADEGGFRDDRLALLVRYGMAIEGRLIDRALIAEIVEAWGETPRD